MLDRRSFLSTLLACTAGFALDPERLLWTPGKKTIFIPPAPKLMPAAIVSAFRVGDIITFGGKFAINPRTGKSTGSLQKYLVAGVTESGFMFSPLTFSPID